ncbi:MAG TPA: cytochrome c biogenesis protein CcdA [Acidimicrobiales bacterium]|nr:cytochrome c biogenesis protein CcdA [Acidimicrobiales bacterium]
MADPGLVVAFGAGMISFLSPCVLPLVPGYLSLMSGVSAPTVVGPREAGDRSETLRILRATLLFATGFTLVFVALGAAATGLGRALLENQRTLNRGAGALIIVMGLVIALGVLPRVLGEERRLRVSPSRLGAFAAPVMGMAFAFGWTPCIGPVLAATLSLAAAESTLGQGMLLLLAYSAGLALPFIAAGVGFARLTGVFAWFRRNARAMNVVSGSVLVVFGVVLMLDRVGWLSAHLVDLMNALGLDRLTAI